MDVHRAGLAEVAALPHDRFAGWPRGAARLALALLALLVALAAAAPGYSPPPPPPPKIAVTDPVRHTVVQSDDDNDVRLYRVINARVRHGDNYYRAATEEQRTHNYPVRPGLTVRLPTLALAATLFGDRGMIVLSLVLFAAMILAMHRRLGAEPGGAERAPMALGLLMAGIASGLDHRYNVLHEIWAAQLLALSFALHRPAAEPARQRGGWSRGWGWDWDWDWGWGWSWLVAALALAVRELVLPYVLLMAVLALRHRRRSEAAAWFGLVALFAAAMAVHLHLAAAWVRPGDPVSPSWLALKGVAGLLYKINNSTFLNLLPLWLSGPCVMLALFGWAGWNTPTGRIGFLLTAGYAAGFMITGRDNNFYWGLLIAPLLFMGAAFAPGALRSLWLSAALTGPRRQVAHA